MLSLQTREGRSEDRAWVTGRVIGPLPTRLSEEDRTAWRCFGAVTQSNGQRGKNTQLFETWQDCRVKTNNNKQTNKPEVRPRKRRLPSLLCVIPPSLEIIKDKVYKRRVVYKYPSKTVENFRKHLKETIKFVHLGLAVWGENDQVCIMIFIKYTLLMSCENGVKVRKHCIF